MMTMAGSIAKRPDGRWRARYRDDTGRDRSRHFTRKVDAAAWLDEVTSTLHAGTYVNPRAGNVTFQQFHDDWAPRQLWVPSTRANADLAVRSVSFGKLPLKTIRRSHIETWVKSMSTRWAPTTIETRFVIVRSVFRAAVADRVIAADPTVGVALPRRRKVEAAMRIPTVAQVGLLLVNADSTRVSTRHGFRAYVVLCAFAGPRKGEAAGVQVGDIDFGARRLTVARQLQATVTHSRCGCRSKVPHVRLHDLRHFYASGLIAAGCDVVTVQQALGHSSATTTLNTYSHLSPTAEDRTRKAAAGLMCQALTAQASVDRASPE